MGEPFAVMVEQGRKARRGFLGGGRGMGGVACFVSSYRTPTRLVSSLNGPMRAAGRALARRLFDF